MTTSMLGRHPLIASVALISMPLAFQIAAVSAAVPDDMWIIFVLSIWASLTTGGFALLVLCGVIMKFMLKRNLSKSANLRNSRSSSTLYHVR